MQAVEAARLETAGAWEQDGGARGAGRERLGAMADTFVARRRRLCMDRPTGSRRREAVAAERLAATWQAVGAARLQALGAAGRSRLSDQAQAVLHVAAPGCACRRMPDVLPGMPARVQGASLPMARHGRHAHQALQQGQEGRSRPRGSEGQRQDAPEAEPPVEGKRAAGQRGEAGHRRSRPPLAGRARPLPPWPIPDAPPQPSA